MKKILSALALWAALLAPVSAANVNIDGLPAASSVAGTDLFECEQSGTNRRCTSAQINTYIQSVWGTGIATFLATPSSANLRAALTDETGTGVAYFVGGALGTPASGTATNLTGLPISTGLAGAGTGVLSALAAAANSSTGFIGALTPTNANCVVGNGTAWTSTTCPTTVTSAVPSTQTGTNYTIVDGDRAKVIYLDNASNQVPTLPSAATLTNSNGWFVTLCNVNTGTQTVTPTTSTIGGASTLLIPAGTNARPVCHNVVSDGTNYKLVPNSGTIFNGTATLGTSAISAGTCATAVNVTTPGVVSTDVATVGFNADPTATTGYLPTAMLTIVPWVATNQVSVKVCNLTGSSITPSAVTINVRVSR